MKGTHTETKKRKKEKHIWKRLKVANKTTRFTPHFIFLQLENFHKRIDTVRSNALQGSVFKSGWLSCIWILELLR